MLKVNSNEMFLLFFTRKEPESVAFVKEEFLHKTIQKKEDVFLDLTENFMKMEKVVRNSMETC